MQDAEEYKQELNLEALQRMKDQAFFVGWQNLEFFVVSPAKSYLPYALVPVF